MKTSSRMLFPAALLALAVAVGCGPRIPAQQAVDADDVVKVRQALLEGTGGEVESTAGAQPEPTGWGTLTGMFKVPTSAAGQLADRPNLVVGGDDAAFCNSHGALKSETVVVDGSTGAIRDVVIFLSDDLSKVEKPDLWLHPNAAPGKTDTVIFDQKYCVFLSHVLPLQTTQVLEIHNSDEKSHNTKLDPASNPPFNQTIAPGSVLTYEHKKEERAPYKASCSVHPWMNAWIFPRDNSYFAVSAADGKFTIPDLPAGVPLTFKIWQEKAGFLKKATINGQEQAIPSKGLPLEIPQDGLTLDVEVDPAALM